MKKCSLEIISSTTGKTLHGNAAVLHYMSKKGGYDNFVATIVKETIETVVPVVLDKINKQTEPKMLFTVIK